MAAIEILLNTQFVSDLILKGEIHGIKEAMEKSEGVGMQTFDSHLQKLYEQGKISFEEALSNSDSPNNLRLKISLNSKNSDIDTPTHVQPKLNIELLEMTLDY
jgi:twitching motility protein PilU